MDLYEPAKVVAKEEESVIARMSTMPFSEYSDEFLKALAVVLRTRMHSYEETEKTKQEVTQSYLEYTKRIQEAVKATEGEIITYEKRIIYPPYHFVSAAKTRGSADSFSTDRIPYLESVDSLSDQESEDYCHTYFFSIEDVAERIQSKRKKADSEAAVVGNIKIKKRDEGNYVQLMEIDSLEITGDQFREFFDLPSSCFELFCKENEMRIVTYGVGHGLGMSLYGAQRMAEMGNDYKKILCHYYPKTEIQVLSE